MFSASEIKLISEAIKRNEKPECRPQLVPLRLDGTLKAHEADNLGWCNALLLERIEMALSHEQSHGRLSADASRDLLAKASAFLQ